MKNLCLAARGLPLACALWAKPASAGSRSDESTSQRMAATHDRCTSSWQE